MLTGAESPLLGLRSSWLKSCSQKLEAPRVNHTLLEREFCSSGSSAVLVWCNFVKTRKPKPNKTKISPSCFKAIWLAQQHFLHWALDFLQHFFSLPQFTASMLLWNIKGNSLKKILFQKGNWQIFEPCLDHYCSIICHRISRAKKKPPTRDWVLA